MVQAVVYSELDRKENDSGIGIHRRASLLPNPFAEILVLIMIVWP